MCLFWKWSTMVVKAELSITDTVVAAVKCILQHGGGRRRGGGESAEAKWKEAVNIFEVQGKLSAWW